MMKTFIQFLCFFVASAMGGCAIQPTMTPAEAAAKVCPSLQITIDSLKQLVGLGTKEVDLLNNVSKIVDPVCNGSAMVQASDLKGLAANAVPTIKAVILASPLPDEKKNEAILAVAAAQIIIGNLP